MLTNYKGLITYFITLKSGKKKFISRGIEGDKEKVLQELEKVMDDGGSSISISVCKKE